MQIDLEDSKELSLKNKDRTLFVKSFSKTDLLTMEIPDLYGGSIVWDSYNNTAIRSFPDKIIELDGLHLYLVEPFAYVCVRQIYRKYKVKNLICLNDENKVLPVFSFDGPVVNSSTDLDDEGLADFITMYFIIISENIMIPLPLLYTMISFGDIIVESLLCTLEDVMKGLDIIDKNLKHYIDSITEHYTEWENIDE